MASVVLKIEDGTNEETGAAHARVRALDVSITPGTENDPLSPALALYLIFMEVMRPENESLRHMLSDAAKRRTDEAMAARQLADAQDAAGGLAGPSGNMREGV